MTSIFPASCFLTKQSINKQMIFLDISDIRYEVNKSHTIFLIHLIQAGVDELI